MSNIFIDLWLKQRIINGQTTVGFKDFFKDKLTEIAPANVDFPRKNPHFLSGT